MGTVKDLVKRAIPQRLIRQRLNVSGCVLFTFDDGPHPDITPRVLDVLDRHSARGLFFIPGGRIGRAPKLLEEIVRRKHGIGNHGFTHTACSRLSFREIIDEIGKCSEEIFLAAGVRTKFFRPPLGIITPILMVAAEKCNHRVMRWSFDCGDYSYLRDAVPSSLAENLLAGIEDRAIVLAHDDHENIPRFLELTLPRLVDRGVDLSGGLASL